MAGNKVEAERGGRGRAVCGEGGRGGKEKKKGGEKEDAREQRGGAR